jgi:hypothetical protein
MAAKRPTGERPKQLSKQAKKYADNPVYLTGNKYNKLVAPSEAAAAAGAKRDFEKRQAAKKPSGTAKKMAAKPSTVQQIAKRFNVTAREARDIATAVSTAASFRNNVHTGTYARLKKDVGTQIKEAGKAAITGKKGTKPAVWKNGSMYDSHNPKR